MRESLEISTQLTQVHEVDMTKVAKLRLKAKNSFLAQNGVKLTFLPFIAKAVAEALKQHPKLNAAYDEDKQEITYHNAEHLAIAVDTDKGLLVPVISDAGNLNLAGLAAKIADVAGRTRDGKIGPDELSGGTFSITNIGSVGRCLIPRSSTSRRWASSAPAPLSSAPWWWPMRTVTTRSPSAP
ncbi:dihydrolipoyllysine-residue acetyltransferase component of pyruvate dehydrogenase complex [Arthrobacter sp. Hiyo4]|nr:dihydrolipoyllysine-residue acetyltransferase component of pyruvate dehydrogenase complex [Arthrobacter sp. Hiyo4]